MEDWFRAWVLRISRTGASAPGKNMPHYLIHVGPHKTGSTYLQVLFQHLSEQLKERGILYPLQWVAEHAPGHSVLAQRLRTGNNAALAAEFQELNGSNYETILISSEDLSRISPESIALLKSYLGGQRASVVFYCRRWLDLLPSSWQELVKHGQSTTFPEFMTSNLMNPFAANIINYGILLERFEQAFGIENISLVSYSNIVDQGGDLAEHFLRSFLAWPNAPLMQGLRPNPSLGIDDIEMIRALNALEWRHHGRRTDRMRVRYLRTRSALDLSVVLAAMEKSRGSLRVNENSRALRTVHEEMFQKYGHRMVPPKSGRYFFVQKAGDIEYISQDYLLAEGVSEALSAAYNQIRE
jgi:hypothetical protein